MKIENYDAINNRTIEQDFDLETLTITGDFAPSSLTTYWVVNKFNLSVPIGIYIKLENAKNQREYLNKKHNTNTFITISRTIFI